MRVIQLLDATGDILPRGYHSEDEYLASYQTLSQSYHLNDPTSCDSAYNCSYNGECKSKVCVCKPQWTGPHCAVLNILPTNETWGYQYILNNQRVSSWGGAVIRDDNGDYHMYAAEMSQYCGIDVWQPNSILIHAKSSIKHSGIATYERVSEIDGIFSHEPDAIRGPNGEYIIYYSHVYPPPTGNASIDPCNSCNDGITISCDAQTTGQGPYIIYTYMIYSNSSGDGPWSEPQIIPTDIGIDSNLAGYIYPNGSFIGIFRTEETIMGMFATDWKDNSTYYWYNVTLDPSNIGEDPFMWMDYDNGDILHTIWHNGGWGRPIGYHRFSNDGGMTWKGFSYDIQTYNNTVYFTNGNIINYQRMERPHLIFDTDGFTPIALTNGAEEASFNQIFYPDYTYTLLRPINQN